MALCVASLGAGCKSGGSPKVDPILQLSAPEALAKGKELLADEKYDRARDFLSHAFEVSPNSVEGREGLLLVADSFYLDGGRSNFIQAEAKYRDFLNRFPTSDRSAYVQFQIANSLAQRMGRPDRDLSATQEAVDAYEDLLRLYPTSEYAAQGREKIRLVKENLAEHEFMVGGFYLRFGLPRAAAERFEYLLETYPSYSEKDKVIFQLGVAQAKGRQVAEARETFERLAREYPDSRYLAEIPELSEPAASEEPEPKAPEDAPAEPEATP
ncbi:MAG TPA: outer membrane protein assembly factor BamD [Thermoanaerobaculia bacterium]|nr:outer membrane protein assembly factor BamD [Thermoanaerobaculia bacterium]